MMSTSLSIVFGMPTTAIFRERCMHSSLMALAPRCVPENDREERKRGKEGGRKLDHHNHGIKTAMHAGIRH